MSIENGGYKKISDSDSGIVSGAYVYGGPSRPKSEVIWNGYKFEPQPDITPYESALATRAMLMLMAYTGWGAIEELPSEAKRHFRKET